MHVRVELELPNFKILANASEICGFLKPPFSNRLSFNTTRDS
jgi:hypothetical protein